MTTELQTRRDNLAQRLTALQAERDKHTTAAGQSFARYQDAVGSGSDPAAATKAHRAAKAELLAIQDEAGALEQMLVDVDVEIIASSNLAAFKQASKEVAEIRANIDTDLQAAHDALVLAVNTVLSTSDDARAEVKRVLAIIARLEAAEAQAGSFATASGQSYERQVASDLDRWFNNLPHNGHRWIASSAMRGISRDSVEALGNAAMHQMLIAAEAHKRPVESILERPSMGNSIHGRQD
jgi:hypothetical protein